MPLPSANWNVLLPVWRGLTGAGAESLARLSAALTGAAFPASGAVISKAAIRPVPAKRADLEPVKPAAALFFLGRARLAALVDLGVGIHRLAIVGRGGAAQQTIGETAIGILDGGALIGIEADADAGVGRIDLGIGQEHLLAGRIIAAHARGHGRRVGCARKQRLLGAVGW